MRRRRYMRTAAMMLVFGGCVGENRSYETEDGAAGSSPTATPFSNQGQATQVEPETTTTRARRTDQITIDGGPTQDTDAIEAAIHWRVNDARIQNDIPDLNFRPKLREYAQAHSQHMALKGYFAHEGPEGRTFNPGCGNWAENLYRESGYGRDPRRVAGRVVGSWLNSDGHRENLLSEAFGSEGIGAAYSSDGVLYVTQTLC